MKRSIWLATFMLANSMTWAGNLQSLRGDIALDAPSAAATAKDWRDGNGKILRNYIQQPPLIPHSTEGLSIDQAGNSCLMCHSWDAQMPGATKIGVSHYLTRSGQALGKLSPRRYFCTQCHVPQNNAKALVGNRFQRLIIEN